MTATVAINNALGELLHGPVEIPRLATVAQLKDRIKPIYDLGSFCRLLLGTRELLDFQRFSSKEFDYPVDLTLDVDNAYSVWAWGNPDLGGSMENLSDSLADDIVSICSNSSAFAAIKKNGEVVAWGDPTGGGDFGDAQLDNVVAICSNKTVFVALKTDGSVVAWGDPDNGGDITEVADKLDGGVIEICCNDYAFAALRNDGSVVTWGSPENGGEMGEAAPQLATGIKAIYNSHLAFVALNDCGGVIAWGHPDYGGCTAAVADDLKSDVIAIYSNDYAFAALREGGRVVVWGNSCGGGVLSAAMTEQLSSGVQAVYRNEGAFVALKAGGVAIAWGDPDAGGDASLVLNELQGNVISVQGTDSAFAALKRDGTVICWGNPERGGDPGLVAKKFKYIKRLYSTEGAFAAVNYRGAVVAWGDSQSGGDCSSVAEDLKKGITSIYTNGVAFAALNRKKGALVTWGSSEYGGDSQKVASQLESGIVNVSCNRFAFAALKDTGGIVTWGCPFYGGESSRRIQQVNSIYCSEGAMVALSASPKSQGMTPTISSVASALTKSLYSAQVNDEVTTEERVAALIQPAAPFDDCHLQRRIGAGSFGEVWQGTWGGSSVAIKVLKSFADGKNRLEGALAEKLSHPNVVQTYKNSSRELKGDEIVATRSLGKKTDSGQKNKDRPQLETWIVMEWCNLGPLSVHVEERRTLHENGDVDMPQVLRILKEVGGAANYLHSRGVVHGDMSANNVLLCERRHGFVCKVCDFGLACIGVDGQFREAGLGTVTHMPPELLGKGDLTPKVDVYSWGVLMYQVYLCSPPWRGFRAPAIKIQIVQLGNRLEMPETTLREYRDIFFRATEHNPDARPSLTELLHDLSSVPVS